MTLSMMVITGIFIFVLGGCAMTPSSQVPKTPINDVNLGTDQSESVIVSDDPAAEAEAIRRELESLKSDTDFTDLSESDLTQ